MKRGAAGNRFSPARRAWAKLGGNEFILFDIGEEEGKDDVYQQGHTLVVRLEGSRARFRLPLHAFTEDEILALQKFWNHVFEVTLPLAREMDEAARQEYEEHGTDYARLYRLPPQFIVRERVQREHDSSVPSGPDRMDGVDSREDAGEAGGLDGHS